MLGCDSKRSREKIPIRVHMREDVAKYMKYYNVDRLRSANFEQSKIEF